MRDLNILLLSTGEFRQNGAQNHGRKCVNYIYTCTVKPYDILKGEKKSALVKSTYHVTEYAVCNLVS
jgi:hypothetical protein